MTGFCEADESMFYRNIKKVHKIATMSGVTSVSITGKGEPLVNFEDTRKVIKEFSDFPVEVQTNGIKISKNTELIDLLYMAGLDVLAISVDNLEDVKGLEKAVERAHDFGLTVRFTFNVTDIFPKNIHFQSFVEICKANKIDQFSFRRITSANYTEENKVHAWIKEHAENNMYDVLINQFKNGNYRMIRNLPYGAKLYDVENMSFTYFDYCIQDDNNDDDIRSLIYMENGHVYTSWNSEASRIF